MDDNTIIQHYWDRDERALTETAEKYGTYCCSIAENILSDREDAKECVNDTYLRAWNTIPPQRPKVLPAFIGRIVRNIAFDLYRKMNASKRGGGQVPLVLDELEECIPDRMQQVECDEDVLSEAVNDFVAALSAKNRKIFVLRYWYSEAVSDIAKSMNISENSVSVTLNRLRRKLQNYLAERGLKP